MTPETAVARLARIIARWRDFTQDEVYDAMADAGIPRAVADRAYKFTQTAWARLLLDAAGVYCAPDYICTEGKGGTTVSGRLDDQPYYAAAVRLAPRYVDSPGFKRLAALSADFNAINAARRSGSSVSGMMIGPAVLFLVPARPRAEEDEEEARPRRRKRRSLEERGYGVRKNVKKPWWKFW